MQQTNIKVLILSILKLKILGCKRGNLFFIILESIDILVFFGTIGKIFNIFFKNY